MRRAQEREAERLAHDAKALAAATAAVLQNAVQRKGEAEDQRQALQGLEGALREWSALTDGLAGLLERFRDHVVDRIGPAIQVEASRLLGLFTGGRYTELLLDSAYDVYVTDNGVRHGLDRFSGGEQDLVHLALRLAVSRLLAERSGHELRFLALDEVFGALDRERRDLVVQALHGLSGLYAQVLVVSHQEVLTEALDQALAVELVDGESRVTLRNG